MKKTANKKPTQTEIAKFYGISQAQMSRIFNKARAISNDHAKLFAKVNDRDWTDYLKMEPAEIKADLIKGYVKFHMANHRHRQHRECELEPAA